MNKLIEQMDLVEEQIAEASTPSQKMALEGELAMLKTNLSTVGAKMDGLIGKIESNFSNLNY